MLEITQQLLTYLRLHPERIDVGLISAYIQTIVLRGSSSDGQALLDYFLKHPPGFRSSYLFPALKKWCSPKDAQKIFETHLQNLDSEEDEYASILELLGEWQYPAVRPLLMQHAFDPASDHYLNRSAVLGLLHYDCRDIQDQIRKKIEETYGKNLFPEFTPALVSKLDEKAEVLELLYESGQTMCSTDCNAGIILGFALSGEEGAPFFQDILFNPHWEADSLATGTGFFTYQGLLHQGILWEDFWHKIQNEPETSRQEQAFKVFTTALSLNSRNFPDESGQAFQKIYHTFFSQDAPNQAASFWNVGRQFQMNDTLYELEQAYLHRVQEEILLKTI